MAADHRSVTFASPPINKSFPGEIEADGHPVPATLAFVGGAIQLLMGDTVVGSWLSHEVEIHPDGDTFQLQAEGDTLSFLPAQPRTFAAFLAGEPTDDIVEELPTISLFDPEPEPEIEVEPADFADPAEIPTLETGTLEAGTLESEIAESGHEIAEDFAVISPVSPEPASEPATEVPVEELAAALGVDDVTDDDALSVPDAEPAPAVDSSRPNPDLPAGDASDLAPAEAPKASPETPASPPVVTLSRTPAEEAEAGEAPEPLDDAENLRQWKMVIAVGVVALVGIGGLIWLLASLFGGDTGDQTADAAPPASVVEADDTGSEPASPEDAEGATAASEDAPDETPVVAAEAEDAPVSAEFVNEWNSVVGQYTTQMRLEPQSLPISNPIASTVLLRYDGDTLRLEMVPTGTGSDRDILVAMGVAVAWADPVLNPEDRKDVLAAVGVDVANPNLADIGGSHSRNGVTYTAAMGEDRLIFEVVAPR